MLFAPHPLAVLARRLQVEDQWDRKVLLALDVYELTVKPGDGLYFQRLVEMRDTPGVDALTADIELVQGGVTVRGQVTDKEGRPVAHARVAYPPLFGNPNVGKLDEETPVLAEATTGADGSYALTVLPGPGRRYSWIR